MAKKVDDDSADKTNTFDPKRVEAIVKKIEAEHEGLLTERMSYMGKCRPYRERIGLAYEEGVGFGIPKKVLKAKIKERGLHRQLDCIPDEFEGDERETFEQVSQALGDYADLPLGKAAVDAADKKGSGGRKAPSPSASVEADDDKDLRPAHLQRNDEDRAAAVAEENGKKLAAGILPLSH